MHSSTLYSDPEAKEKVQQLKDAGCYIVSYITIGEDDTLEVAELVDRIKEESIKTKNELEKETKGVDVKVKLHLSGTPYRILLGSEFEKEDVRLPLFAEDMQKILRNPQKSRGTSQ